MSRPLPEQPCKPIVTFLLEAVALQCSVQVSQVPPYAAGAQEPVELSGVTRYAPSSKTLPKRNNRKTSTTTDATTEPEATTNTQDRKSLHLTTTLARIALILGSAGATDLRGVQGHGPKESGCGSGNVRERASSQACSVDDNAKRAH